MVHQIQQNNLKEKGMVGIVDGKKGSIFFYNLKAKVFFEFLA
jgi:hypothetical protein